MAVETVSALFGGEEDVAVQFLRSELFLALQIAVEFGVAGHQRAHVLGDGLLHALHGDFFGAEGLAEHFGILAVGA